ncbi:hypothetical protein fugu_009397 [Takifugu bimaculatus]|uniref:Uncharacterized protein n=1 Tax=Takifugu bimaculatus TaxID=433685 RepID=A0A4Z2B086_9TELE|nr:hypothetical protein fugu_009397 [Takifugu bimaculatus]
MLVTHLQGPHQSVCWLRPKRARHFLGEPGSEHRHAQHEQGEGGVGVGGGGVRHQRRESVEEERGGGGRTQFRESQQLGLVSSSSEEHQQQQGSDARAFGSARTSSCACVGGERAEN